MLEMRVTEVAVIAAAAQRQTEKEMADAKKEAKR